MLWAARYWRELAVAIVALALFALGGLGFWRGLVAIERLQTRAAELARSERDAHWRAEISAANAKTQAARAEQAIAVSIAEARAAEAQRTIEIQSSELEKANAALAGGDRGGLERDRVRLLNGAKP